MRIIEEVYTVSEIKRKVIELHNSKEDVMETFLRNDQLYVLKEDNSWYRVPLSDTHIKMLVYKIAEQWRNKALKCYTFDRNTNLVTLTIIEEE